MSFCCVIPQILNILWLAGDIYQQGSDGNEEEVKCFAWRGCNEQARARYVIEVDWLVREVLTELLQARSTRLV